MKIILKQKQALTNDQLNSIDLRIQLPIHAKDLGVPLIWNVYTIGLLAFFDEASGSLIALVEASGDETVSPGWWIDSAFRGQGFGKQVIDLLADHLKSCGVKRISSMPITTYRQKYDAQSEKLAIRLRSHFDNK